MRLLNAKQPITNRNADFEKTQDKALALKRKLVSKHQISSNNSIAFFSMSAVFKQSSEALSLRSLLEYIVTITNKVVHIIQEDESGGYEKKETKLITPDKRL